jgi:hypothetical protein
MRRSCLWRAIIALTTGLALATPGLANDAVDDPSHACDRAAVRAEADWHLPSGVLAAIGAVESGRTGLGSTLPVPWPWTVNAGGRGLYLSNKESAIAAVRALHEAGVRVIDLGCFQVDIFFHPAAFASLDAAFDPETNAQAAALILTRSRQVGNSWETAVALYHSASAVRGQQYLRRVQTAWPLAIARSEAGLNDGYVVFLSQPAEQVRIIVPSTPLMHPVAGMPRVLN